MSGSRLDGWKEAFHSKQKSSVLQQLLIERTPQGLQRCLPSKRERGKAKICKNNQATSTDRQPRPPPTRMGSLRKHSLEKPFQDWGVNLIKSLHYTWRVKKEPLRICRLAETPRPSETPCETGLGPMLRVSLSLTNITSQQFSIPNKNHYTPRQVSTTLLLHLQQHWGHRTSWAPLHIALP